MAKLTYTLDEKDFISEASKIEFTVSEDMDIYQFHTMCIRMAHAMGYHAKSIERAFGKGHDYPQQSEEDKELIKQLLKG